MRDRASACCTKIVQATGPVQPVPRGASLRLRDTGSAGAHAVAVAHAAAGPLAALVRESAATPNTMPTRHTQPATSYQKSLIRGFCSGRA